MQLSDISQTLLSALKEYDAAILPLGLYASDELVAGRNVKSRQMEWKGALIPAIRSFDGRILTSRLQNIYCYEAAVNIPELGRISLEILRYSKIKVRKFGSSYHVDKHEDRSERKNRVDLSGHISNLWKQKDAQSGNASILLLIAFDKDADPLQRELHELENELNWKAKNVMYQTRFWLDKAERGFSVRLSAWARYN